ncbi:Sulfate permease [Acidisarcina polymorpha]|uniref:Sulfate permease n=1 Tax=Acidisarcina polymorpha TaxID=2211140 RepID=A0A2Z5FUJ0_9BACT|nr:sulfate permease [Acidisarcina polymorpha]AXC10402.1 Sulfate permease [Acidisarcina polymorpha]
MNLQAQWLPRSVQSLREYTPDKLVQDLIAGITVGLVALPLAMAFAIASGVPPQAGIYTAVVAGFLISALGGSRTQIGGPTGAFVVIVAGIVAKFGTSGLALVGMMAGVLLVIMGLTGLGTAVKFIPRPVIIGFTNGIALLIASTQIKDFLGLKTPPVPSEFLERMTMLAKHIQTIRWQTFLLGALSLAIILLWPRVTRRFPGTIVALLLATLATSLFHLQVETIGSKFGGIPQGFPHFELPQFHAAHVLPLLPSVFTVALLAAVESLLSAVVADGMSGDRHNSNVELTAQGIANIVSPLFGGIPATGAIARTATNIRSGARTPVAGMVHALTLLMVLLVAAPLAKFVPLATLASVLFVVAYSMGEWREIGGILRLSKTDIVVWFSTFALTVFTDLTVAVGVGMALAALLYIQRVAATTSVEAVTADYVRDGMPHVLQDKEIPDNVTILRIHGPFLFGTTDKLADIARDLTIFAPVVIVRLRNMTAIDATGVHALEQFAERLRMADKTLVFCGARDQPRKLLLRTEFLKSIGPENFLPHVQAALVRAREINEGFGSVGREMAVELEAGPL